MGGGRSRDLLQPRCDLFRVPVQPTVSALSFSPPAAIFTSLTGVKGNHHSWTVMPDGGALVLENASAISRHP